WESGQLPSLPVLRPLAQALGVSLDHLIPENGGLAELAKPPPKRSAQPRTAKRPRAKAGQAAGRGPQGPLGGLDAAAQVLGETRKAMNCRELIGVMAAKGYWKSAGGRTPWASLHAGIMKEIAAQGRRARFRKVGRGQFARR